MLPLTDSQVGNLTPRFSKTDSLVGDLTPSGAPVLQRFLEPWSHVMYYVTSQSMHVKDLAMHASYCSNNVTN